MFGDAAEVRSAGGDVDEEQQVEAPQGHGVDGGEITCDGGLRAQELRPGHRGPLGCGVDVGVLQNQPDCRSRDRVAQASEFAVDAAVAPGRVVAGEAKDELAELGGAGLSSGWPGWLGPVPGDAAAVPAQQGVGGDEPASTPGAGERGWMAPSRLGSSSFRSGRSVWRCNTASWWRRTTISRSFERPERTARWARAESSRYRIRFTRLQPRPASSQVNTHDRVIGTHG